MRAFVRLGLLALLPAFVVLAQAHAQTPPATKGASATPTPALNAAAPGAAAAPALAPPPAPYRPANLEQVVATVNGEPITKGELVDFLSRYQIPPGNDEVVYRDAVDTLVNMKLITQYLTRQKIAVAEDKVTEAIKQLEAQLKADGSSLASELLASNKTTADLRKEFGNRQRWVDFVTLKATDAALQKFAAAHKDLLSNTQVRASHILLKFDPKTTTADKDKIRQKLVAIKQAIESGKTTFAEAANKYSEDPANAQGTGGDIGYFGLNSGIVEEFAGAAFALPKGKVSDPVETVYGYHLIEVTDRKDGPAIDFAKMKPAITNAYAAELQKEILIAESKAAKVDVKPMPADLFPPTPTPTPAPATTPTAPADATKGTAPK